MSVSGAPCQQKRRLTSTWHGHNHININIQETRLVVVHAELVVRPSPDKLANIVQQQHKDHESYEDGHKSSRFRPSLVRRRELWKGIELSKWCYLVEFVQQ